MGEEEGYQDQQSSGGQNLLSQIVASEETIQELSKALLPSLLASLDSANRGGADRERAENSGEVEPNHWPQSRPHPSGAIRRDREVDPNEVGGWSHPGSGRESQLLPTRAMQLLPTRAMQPMGRYKLQRAMQLLITRAMQLLTRAMSLRTRAMQLLTRAMQLLTRAIPLLTRAMPLLTRAMSLLTRAMPLLTRAMQLHQPGRTLQPIHTHMATPVGQHS